MLRFVITEEVVWAAQRAERGRRSAHAVMEIELQPGKYSGPISMKANTAERRLAACLWRLREAKRTRNNNSHETHDTEAHEGDGTGLLELMATGPNSLQHEEAK